MRGECDHDGVGLPMAARRMIAKPDTAEAPAVAPQQIRGDAAFVEKDVLLGVVQRLVGAPAAALSRDVGPTLFVGVHRFF